MQYISFDTETHLIQKGLLAPPLVCGSVAYVMDGQISGRILTKEQTLREFEGILAFPDTVMIGANIAYDLLVCAVEFAKRGEDIIPLIFQALDEGRIFDVQIAEALNAVAGGHLGKDARTGGPLINPETGKPGRYSLATCVDQVLGRKDAKKNDEWRLRYAELDGVPMEEWPQPAKDYPVDDAVNTLECGLAQLREHRNLHDVSNQVRAAFAMHLGAAWGFKVNQDSVDIIERHAQKNKDADKPFIAAGILRADGSQDLGKTKRMVAQAYGASEACTECKGKGKIINPNAPLIRCPTCKGHGSKLVAMLKLSQPNPTGAWMDAGPCEDCFGVGKIQNPKALVNCVWIPDALSDEAKRKTCDGTGLVLTEHVPRSEKEGVAYGRDVLYESGDELLMNFANYNEDQKILSVYVPYLRQGRIDD